MHDPRDAHELLDHDDFLRALARSLVLDAARADDVVQQTYVAALTRPPGVRLATNPRGWLAAVAKNLASKLVRSESRRAKHEERAARGEALPSVADVLAREQARRRVVAAVLKLDEPARTTMLLRYFDRLPPRAIAKRLGEPVETVRTRIKRALVRLRGELDSEYGGERGAWLAALFPFAKAAPASTVAAAIGATATLATSIAGGVLVMSAKAKVALAVAAVAVGVAVTMFVQEGGFSGDSRRPDGLDAPPSLPAPAVAAERDLQRAERDEEPAAAAAPVVAEPPSGSRLAAGSVVVRAFWESDHTPAVAIGVTLASWFDAHAQAFSGDATTNRDGRCTFTNVAAGAAAVFGDRGGSSQLQVKGGVESAVELLIPPGQELAGVVVDSDDVGVRDAEIWLSGERATLGRVVARTDAEGRFTVRSVSAPQVVGARAAGFAPSPLLSFQHGARDATRLRFVLSRRGGALAGQVYCIDHGKRVAVAGALVQAGDEHRLLQVSTRGDMSPLPLLLRQRSDADGRFRFDGVMTGDVALLVRSVDFAPWRGSVAIKAGTAAEVDVELVAGATLEGRVLRADGTAAADAEVRVGASDSIAASRMRCTGEGTFRFDHLAPGPFEVVASNVADGGARASLVAADGATLRWDARLVAGPSLRGRVVDQAEHAVAGCTIRAMAHGETPNDYDFRDATTGDDGRFVVENCDRRPYQVEVRPPAIGFTSSQFAQDVVPGGDELLFHLSHAQPATASIVGLVADADGIPVGEAMVFPLPRTGGALVGNTFTTESESGRFNARMLAPGAYSVVVRKEGYPELQTPSFELAANERRDLGTIRLPRGGTLRATLIRDDGHELAAMDVQTLSVNDGYRRPCEVDGDLATAALAPGRYELRTIGGGCAPARAKFEIAAGKETAIEVSLAPAPEVVLVVAGLDAVLAPRHSNTPYAFTRLVDAAGTLLDERSLPAFADRRAEWRVNLLPGDYRIEVVAGRDVIGRATFTVPDGPVAEEFDVTVR